MFFALGLVWTELKALMTKVKCPTLAFSCSKCTAISDGNKGFYVSCEARNPSDGCSWPGIFFHHLILSQSAKMRGTAEAL